MPETYWIEQRSDSGALMGWEQISKRDYEDFSRRRRACTSFEEFMCWPQMKVVRATLPAVV